MDAGQLREMYFTTVLPGATVKELKKTPITSLEMKRAKFFEFILRLSLAKFNVQI